MQFPSAYEIEACIFVHLTLPIVRMSDENFSSFDSAAVADATLMYNTLYIRFVNHDNNL